ncbi:TPA: hypothetical protein P5J41_002497, partial [Legionella pneumophila]|nr:hypothetical protein [Legionella pneumophila]
MHELIKIIYPDAPQSLKTNLSFKNEQDIQLYLEQVLLQYKTHHICEEVYSYMSLHFIEMHHDELWDKGEYNHLLNPISEKMRQIERKYGLTENQYWRLKDSPQEYQTLANKYSKILDQKLIDLLKKFHLADLAYLAKHNRKKFDELRERGRRIIHNQHQTTEAVLHDSIINYENEAINAANSGAYLAAIVSLAAALEGLLILVCMHKRPLAIDAYKKIGKTFKTRFDDELNPQTWKFNALIEVCDKANFFTPIKTEFVVLKSRDLANMLRQMRNFIHPAKRINNMPWSNSTKSNYSFYKNVYISLLYSLGFLKGKKV